MIVEGYKEDQPVGTLDIDIDIREIEEYKSTINQRFLPLILTSGFLHQAQTETADDLRTDSVHVPWSTLMERFQWRAGCSLFSVLNDYAILLPAMLRDK